MNPIPVFHLVDPSHGAYPVPRCGMDIASANVRDLIPHHYLAHQAYLEPEYHGTYVILCPICALLSLEDDV